VNAVALEELESFVDWRHMLARDPFDIISFAKLHLADGPMDTGDRQAYYILAVKQEELL
jgi:hypothetical protein